MRDRTLALIERVRGRLDRDGRARRLFEPLVTRLALERGLGGPTLAYVRHRGLAIAGGPFRGVRYPRRAAPHVQGLVAVLTGAYEAELHPAIERLIAASPELVVNVGAGWGLYATGMAARCPGANIVAFEADPYHARICAAVAAANGVAGRIELRGECTPERLGELGPAPRAALICDCDGCERALIDPERVEWLREAPIVVEVHDALDPGVAAELRGRLAATHSVESVDPAPRYLRDYPMLWDLPGMSPVAAEALIQELRPFPTPWLVALPREGYSAAA
jgi:hypothetical protein